MANVSRGMLLAWLMLVLAAGCQSAHKPPKDASLYVRLGEERTIRAIVDDFVHRVAIDRKANFTRKGTPYEWSPTPENISRLEDHLVQFIESTSGGPMKYEGRPMKPLHKGMQITNAEFDAFLWDLRLSLDHFGINDPERTELILSFDATRKDIVEEEE